MKFILLIEDHFHLGALYQEELGEAGYKTLCVDNGGDASRYMAQYPFDLVILEPGVPGVEAIERMLAAQPALPVLINSASASDKTGLHDWCAAGFVTKSSDLSELKWRIQQLLEPAQLARPI